jgi:integrase
MGKRRSGEGTIFKRDDGRWAANLDLGYEGGKRRRKTLYGATQREVGEKLDAARREIAEGRPLTDGRLRLSSYLETWLKDVVEPSSLAMRTKDDYRDHVRRHIVPLLGHIRLAALSPQDVQRLINAKRAEGLSPRTVQYIHAVLRRALGQAETWRLVPRNVAKLVSVDTPKPDPSKVHELPLESAHRLLEAVMGDRLYALYVVLLTIGLRKGEVLGLRWVDLDFKRGTLSVEQQVQRVNGRGLLILPLPKTKTSRRTNSLSSYCLETLLAHRASQATERLAAGDCWHDHDLIFPSKVGTPFDPRNLNRHMHAMCRKVGIRLERIHNLRHTNASVGFDQGLEVKTVSGLLGHSSVGITSNLYIHLQTRLKQAAAELIGEALRPPSTPVAVNLAVNGAQAHQNGPAVGGA